MLNFADLGVFIIIAFFTIIGFNVGLFVSIFKLASYFIAIWFALRLYPNVTAAIMETRAYESIKTAIGENFLRPRAEAIMEKGEDAIGNFFNTIVESIPLPEFVKEYILQYMPETGASTDIDAVVENISSKMAEFAVSIFSLVAIFIAVKIALVIFRHLLEGVTKLPVVKQVDKAGGLLLGAAEGVLTVYFLMALLMLFNTTETFGQIHGWIESSMFASRFFENNFIIEIMFPGS